MNNHRNTQEHEYMLLGRLQQDCYSYLDHGCKLWGGTPQVHAQEMVKLYNSLKIKPEWLPLKELKELYYKLTHEELKVLHIKESENAKLELTIDHYNNGEVYYTCIWYKCVYKNTNEKFFNKYSKALDYFNNLNIDIY